MRKCSIFLALLLALLFLVQGACLAAAPEEDALDNGGEEIDSGEDALVSSETEGEDAAEETPAPTPGPTPTPSPQPTAPPVENPDFAIDAQIGYDGLVVMRSWTPVFVTVSNQGAADFDGMLGVNVFYTLNDYDGYEVPLTLAAGASKQVKLPVKPQMRQDMYAVELVENGVIIAEKRITPKRLTAPEAIAVGLLSESPQALAYLDQRANGLHTLRGESWVTAPLTVDTFPDTSDLMSMFSLLVIDGVDARTLTEAQQDALKAWVMEGGIVFVSGGAKAASGYPFFAEWTELPVGQLAEAEDVTPALLSYVGLTSDPVGASIWLNALPKAGAVVSSGENGLVFKDSVENGLVFSFAFDLSGKPLASWSTMSSLLPRLLRQSAATEYTLMINRNEESRYASGESWQARSVFDQLQIENAASGIPVLLLLLLFLLLVGLGGYFLLRRFDRREWLWITAPVTVAVFALLLFALSRTMTMNKPIALSASRLISNENGTQMSTYIGITTPDNEEITVTTDQQRQPVVVSTDDGYWYDDTTTKDRLFRPVHLRQRYRFGAQPALSFADTGTWDLRMLALTGLTPDIGKVEGRIWMEADGMHGEVLNQTEHPLEDCFVVTSVGFAILENILPGGSAQFALLYPDSPIDQSVPEFVYQPGILYSTLDIDTQLSGAYYDNGLYSYLYQAVYRGEDQNEPAGNQRMAMVELFQSEFSFYESRSTFYFFGFNDALGQVGIHLNGQPVVRSAHTAVLGSRLDFEPIGPTGEVMFPRDTIPVDILVDQGEAEKPRDATPTDTNNNSNNAYGPTTETYLYIGTPAAIRFTLPEWGKYDIEKMVLFASSYETTPSFFLYNYATDSWEEQKLLSLSMNGEKWAPYISDTGEILARYVSPETANRYVGMQMPSISLKGQVK